MLYRVGFTGRPLGSIGIIRYFDLTIEASDEKAVLLKLYDEYEHITVVNVVPTAAVKP